MGEPEPNIICVKDPHGDWLSIEFNWDASINKWARMFVTILGWMVYGAGLIDGVFSEGYENWMWEEGNEINDFSFNCNSFSAF